jgi:hypothetical protein
VWALVVCTSRGVLRLGEVEQVGDQALFIHAVGRGAFVDGRHDAPILAPPGERRLSVAGPLESARVQPKIRVHVRDEPVHGSPGDGLSVLAEVDGTAASFGKFRC